VPEIPAFIYTVLSRDCPPRRRQSITSAINESSVINVMIPREITQ
jgi:hypothetical protein